MTYSTNWKINNSLLLGMNGTVTGPSLSFDINALPTTADGPFAYVQSTPYVMLNHLRVSTQEDGGTALIKTCAYGRDLQRLVLGQLEFQIGYQTTTSDSTNCIMTSNANTQNLANFLSTVTIGLYDVAWHNGASFVVPSSVIQTEDFFKSALNLETGIKPYLDIYAENGDTIDSIYLPSMGSYVYTEEIQNKRGSIYNVYDSAHGASPAYPANSTWLNSYFPNNDTLYYTFHGFQYPISTYSLETIYSNLTDGHYVECNVMVRVGTLSTPAYRVFPLNTADTYCITSFRIYRQNTVQGMTIKNQDTANNDDTYVTFDDTTIPAVGFVGEYSADNTDNGITVTIYDPA